MKREMVVNQSSEISTEHASEVVSGTSKLGKHDYKSKCRHREYPLRFVARYALARHQYSPYHLFNDTRQSGRRGFSG